MLRRLYQQLDEAQKDYDYCKVYHDTALTNLQRAETKLRDYEVGQVMDQMLFQVEWEVLSMDDDTWFERHMVSETLFEIVDSVVKSV